MNHFDAMHNLRILVSETGNLGHTNSLNFILDELREANKAQARLILERDEARRKVAELVQNLELNAPTIRGEIGTQQAVEAVKRIAAEQNKKLGG